MFTKHLTNNTTTQNGAKAYTSSLSAVLDLYSMGITSSAALQDELIAKAFTEDPILALKAILYSRDVRDGQGNRDLFRRAMDYLIATEPTIVNFLLPHIPEIGRWKDVYELYGKDKKLDITILHLIDAAIHLNSDALCAKWFPRQSKLHKDYAKTFNYDIGDVRRFVAKLSKTVETQMCNRNWHEIKYESVPSIANIKYNKAFLRNDQSRRERFLEDVLAGKTTAKATVTYPHDIANMIFNNRYIRDPKTVKSADALWSQLPNYMTENQFNILPIIDTSGSMLSAANGTTASCISIAAGLGIYMAERNVGEYKNLWMNFSTRPQAYYLKGSTLSEKIYSLDYNNWSGSTNLDAAMQMVLDAAKKSPSTAPKAIIIVSDMEFNPVYGGSCVNFTNYEKFKADFQAIGLEMPTTIFWRVNTASKQQPSLLNDKKVLLINGYSPTILKEILQGSILEYTPEKAMRAILEPKYTFIDEALKDNQC